MYQFKAFPSNCLVGGSVECMYILFIFHCRSFYFSQKDFLQLGLVNQIPTVARRKAIVIPSPKHLRSRGMCVDMLPGICLIDLEVLTLFVR